MGLVYHTNLFVCNVPMERPYEYGIKVFRYVYESNLCVYVYKRSHVYETYLNEYRKSDLFAKQRLYEVVF